MSDYVTQVSWLDHMRRLQSSWPDVPTGTQFELSTCAWERLAQNSQELINVCSDAIDRDECVYICYTDFSRKFDSVSLPIWFRNTLHMA